MGIGSLGLRAACLRAKAFATAGCRFRRDSLPARRSFSEGWAVRRWGDIGCFACWGCRGALDCVQPAAAFAETACLPAVASAKAGLSGGWGDIGRFAAGVVGAPWTAAACCRFCRDSLPARRSFSEGWAVRRLGGYRVLCVLGLSGWQQAADPKAAAGCTQSKGGCCLAAGALWQPGISK